MDENICEQCGTRNEPGRPVLRRVPGIPAVGRHRGKPTCRPWGSTPGPTGPRPPGSPRRCRPDRTGRRDTPPPVDRSRPRSATGPGPARRRPSRNQARTRAASRGPARRPSRTTATGGPGAGRHRTGRRRGGARRRRGQRRGADLQPLADRGRLPGDGAGGPGLADRRRAGGPAAAEQQRTGHASRCKIAGRRPGAGRHARSCWCGCNPSHTRRWRSTSTSS